MEIDGAVAVAGNCAASDTAVGWSGQRQPGCGQRAEPEQNQTERDNSKRIGSYFCNINV